MREELSGMFEKRYGPYPKKKEKGRVRVKEGGFFDKSLEWLKWTLIQIGDFSFHKPCLQE
jgi:hypothetical protein